jgi:hypothetical protein
MILQQTVWCRFVSNEIEAINIAGRKIKSVKQEGCINKLGVLEQQPRRLYEPVQHAGIYETRRPPKSAINVLVKQQITLNHHSPRPISPTYQKGDQTAKKVTTASQKRAPSSRQGNLAHLPRARQKA